MATQKELYKTYMDMAVAMSKLSKGVRAKVGAVAVTKNGVVVVGVNGLPKPLGNELEDKTYTIISKLGENTRLVCDGLKSKNTVIHAETNLLVKCAREGVSMIGSTVFAALCGGVHCGSMLGSFGVTRGVYFWGF